MIKSLIISGLLAFSVLAIDLNSIPDNTWIKLDNITMVFPSGYTGNFNLRYWCNFVWDPDSQRILFFEGYGGSHNQINGGGIYANAIYSFLPANETVRLINVSTYWINTGYSAYVAGSGPETPHPRHTYGGFKYVPKYKNIYMAFGACAHAPNCDTKDMWKYHIPTDTWTKIAAPWPDNDLGGYDANFLHLPGSDTLWVFTQNSGTWISLHAFNMADETWSQKIDYGVRTHSSRHGAEDTLRRRMLYLSSTGYHFLEPSTGALTKFADTTDGLPANAVMTYIPKYDRYFIYSRWDQEIWILNPADTSFELAANNNDPGKRIDRYITYDPLNDVIATFNVDNEYHVFRYKPETTSVEKVGLVADRVKILVSPNPFNSTVKIMVRRYAYGVRRVSTQIYDISGKLVKDFTPYASRITPYTFAWNTAALPSGIYILRATVGSRTFTKRIFLQK
jgi:hypothetical protein